MRSPFVTALFYLPGFTHRDVGRRYIELFPNKRVLPEDIVVTFKEIDMHAHAENITSETCLAPFASNEVASMLGLVDHLKVLTRSVNTPCGLLLD